MANIRIKVCGVTTPDDALLCVDAKVDMLGLIFAESPRKIDAKRAYEIVRAIPPDRSTRSTVEVGGPFSASLLQVHPVAVFKDQPLDEMRRILDEVGLVTAQLHGDEPPEVARALKLEGKFVIKAMSPDRLDAEYPADIVLLDVSHRRDHEAARALGRRLFLSGTLETANVGEWIRELRPVGVDVCRGTEASPGRKDPVKLKEFVRAVRHAG